MADLPPAASIETPTAIVHDWFQGMHGAERVVEVMRHDLFTAAHPADIYTFYAALDLLPPGLAHAIRGQSRLARSRTFRQTGYSPGRWRYLLPLMPLYFRHLRLDRYGLVISSSHSFALHARAAPDAVHVCYCHTPIRYAWLPPEEGDRLRGLTGWALARSRRAQKAIDRRAAQRPDSFVANSEAVRYRIETFYGREATVIHPPVDVGDFDATGEKVPGRFLWVHRLVPHKRPEIVVEAFRGLPYELTMVGTGMLEEPLRSSLPPNVTLRSWVSREELVALHSSATGFIHVGEEDFGITMVEALASGTPVIGLDAGGARDIVRPEVDGVLLPRADVRSLRDAIEAVAERRWDRDSLRARAETFSRGAFVQRFRDHLASLGIR